MINDFIQSACVCIFAMPISLLNLFVVSFSIKLLIVHWGFPISSWLRSALVTLCMIIASFACSMLVLLMRDVILQTSFFFFKDPMPTEVWFSPICVIGFMLIQSLFELPVASIMTETISKKRLYAVLCSANFLVGIVGWVIFAGYL